MEELSEFLDASAEDIRQSLANSGKHISMDAPLLEGDENSSSMYDVLPNTYVNNPEDTLFKESLKKDIERSLSTLSARESEIVRLFYGLNGKHPLSLDEIGELFDLTRERVRQIKEKAVRRLKHTYRSKGLKGYLG